jgi:hypothetical protein
MKGVVFLILLLAACSSGVQPIAVGPVPASSPASLNAGASLVPPAPDVDVMRYIAEGSTFLMVFDMRRLAASPLRLSDSIVYEIERLKEEPFIHRLLKAGVDPLSNVDKIVVSGDLDTPGSAIVLTGSFDAVHARDSLQIMMETSGARGVVEAPSANTLILSERDELSALVMSARGLRGSPLVEAVMPLANTDEPFYVVANVSSTFASKLKRYPFKGLETITRFTASADLGSGIDVVVVSVLASEEDVKQSKVEMEAMLPTLASFVVSPGEIMSTIKIEADGVFLRLSLSLSLEQLRWLFPKKQ